MGSKTNGHEFDKLWETGKDQETDVLIPRVKELYNLATEQQQSSCPWEVSHADVSCKPPTRQSLIYVLLLFISFYLNEKSDIFKQAWETETIERASYVYVRLQLHSLLQNQQSRKFRAEGTDSVWSQTCSCLLSINFLFLIKAQKTNSMRNGQEVKLFWFKTYISTTIGLTPWNPSFSSIKWRLS